MISIIDDDNAKIIDDYSQIITSQSNVKDDAIKQKRNKRYLNADSFPLIYLGRVQDGQSKTIRVRGKQNKRTIIGEVLGEIIPLETAMKRMRRDRNEFIIKINSKWAIDMRRKGNWARFVEHSCNPNTKIIFVLIDGKPRVFLEAIKTIKDKYTITRDYGPLFLQAMKVLCHCNGRGKNECGIIIGLPIRGTEVVLY